MHNTKDDIGFVLPKLEHNPLCDNIIKCVNKFVSNNPNNQYIVFNSYNSRYDMNRIPVLHLSECKFFHGNLILFDLMSVVLTKSFPNIHQRFVYLQEIPWQDKPQAYYESFENVLEQSKLEFIAQNKHIYDIYSICWKDPVCVSEEFEYETIKKIL